MFSRAVSGWGRRAVAILIVVFALTPASALVRPAVATPVALRLAAGNAALIQAGAAPLVLANWGGGCWRCGRFVGFNRPFFFHRPFFVHNRFFFHRRFNDFDNDFDDRFRFGR